MRIQPLSFNIQKTDNTKQKARVVTKPYAIDTLYFSGKPQTSELKPLDLYCAKALNAPVEKIEDKRDFDRWAQDEFYEKSNINKYYSNFSQDNIDRIYRLDVWKEKLKNNYYQNNPALALLVLDTITSPLSPNNHEQPPIFNATVFQKTVKYLTEDNNIKNYSFQPTFRRVYENTLRHYIISGDSTVGKLDTKWVKIPSKINDEKNFKLNLKKLKILSDRRWCTKATHAQTYLENGDFYIYLKKGQPKVFITAKDDKVTKIQCGADSSRISYKYADILNEFIENENLITDRNEQKLLIEAKNTEKRVELLKNELADDIKNNRQEDIFNKLGIETSKNDDRTLVISHYKQPDESFTYKDLGIDENLLLKNVVEIQGNADFIRSNATVLNNLKKIGKDANFMYSKIKSLENLEHIGGLANFMYTKNLHSLPKLSYVGEKIATDFSQIDDMPLL